MRKTKLTAILLVVASMLCQIIPTAWAQTIDGIDLVKFDTGTTLTSSDEYTPVVYGTNYGSSNDFGTLSSKLFGRKRISNVWNAFATLNFDNIENSSFAAYAMEYKNGNVLDISDLTDTAKVVFDLDAEDTVSIDNLYYAVMTRGTDGIDFAGVPVTALVETKDFDISEFSKPENFLCSTGTGTAIDLAKFCGIGYVRMNVAEGETAPESSGRIYTKKLGIVKLNAIDDLAAEAFKGNVILTFTAPMYEDLEYTIDINGNDGSERTVTLTSADFDVDGSDYVWTDNQAEQEVTYTYTITLTEGIYGLSSVSNAAVVKVPEDIGGEDIPQNGESSSVVDIPVRNYSWYDGIDWLDYALGAPKSTQTYNPRGNKAELATQSLLQIDLGYDKLYKNEAEATEYYGHVFDFYTVGYIAGNLKGGPSNAQQECTNISAVQDTASVYFRMYIDPTMELSNAYFTIGQRWYSGQKDRINFVGVPMYDYITDADKGKVISVSIPLTDFKMSNPNRINRIWSYSWDSKAPQEEAEADLQYFNFIGLMRDCNPANEQPASSGYIYISDMKVCDVKTVSNLEVRDVSPSKIVLGWEHSETLVKKYNIYRDVNGEKQYVGSSVLNRFADSNDDNGFEIGESYKYYVEAEDEIGVKSQLIEVTATVEPVAKPRNFKVKNYYSDTDTLAVDISWQAASYGSIEKYVLYRNGMEYEEFAPDEVSFRDLDVDYSRTYTYHMVAVDTEGNHSIDTEKITVTAACVADMSNVQYTINDNDVTFTWDSVENATKYGLKVNGAIYLTEDTSYTVADLPYCKEIGAYVWAINSANAKSVEFELNKFGIEKPGTTIGARVFNETVASGFKADTSGVAIAKVTSDKFVSGNASMLCDFTQKLLEDQYIKFSHGGWNIERLRNNNSALTFWIYVEDEVELDKLSLALEGTATLYWSTQPLRATVKLQDYITENNKWVYVEIPLTSFKDTGIAEYQGQFYEKPMDYQKIKGLSFIYNNSLSIAGAKFYLDDIKIVTGQPWQVADVQDENGTSVATELSANAKVISAVFSEAMDVSTINSANVWVEDAAGNIVKTFTEYNEGKCNIKFLEALEKSTSYKLKMENIKSSVGVTGSFEKAFTTNEDEISGEISQIPAIAPVITSTNSGSTATVKLTMPQGATYNVDNYNITISYDKQKVSPNGASATVLGALSGATVTVGDGVITISGNAQKAILSGELVSVTFAAATTGQTTITVGGTMDVANVKSDDITSVEVASSKSVTLTKGGSGGGGGGGGGGSTAGTAGRDNATIKGDEEIELTEGESQQSGSVFADINNVLWAKDSILALVKEGIMSGYPDNTVRPENTITREEFASLLVRTFGFKSELTESPFADVANDAWYTSAIIVAQEKGIVSGVDAENFGIGSTITREDMCTMIYRAIQAARMSTSEKYDSYVFADNDSISQYAQDAVKALYQSGLISGVSDTEFAPKAEVNRAMAARVLHGVKGLM